MLRLRKSQTLNTSIEYPFTRKRRGRLANFVRASHGQADGTGRPSYATNHPRRYSLSFAKSAGWDRNAM